MMENSPTTNEEASARAFTAQSAVFDEQYHSNTIIQYKRQRVRAHIAQHIKSASHILELNAGTGEDAIYLAQHGHRVHATDISGGMQEILKKKVNAQGLTASITNELCSYTNLENLMEKGPYDLIFSNFAGLNCTSQLDKVLSSFSPLLKAGGLITLVLLPGFCLWESLLVFKGKFKTAFRRFFAQHGAAAHIEGEYFTCWYYNPAYITNVLKDSFDLIALEGLCTIVPPSYIEHFAERHRNIYRMLVRQEGRLKNKWPWKYFGDYYIITLRKKVVN